MSAQTPRVLTDRATTIIRGVYRSAAQPLDPHRTLTNVARSVAILGDLLGGFADQYYKAGKKYASMVAAAGRVLWGIVELSVPHTIGYYLLRNWMKVATTLAVLVIALGLFTGTTGMAKIGWSFLAIILGLALTSRALHLYMLNGRWPGMLLLLALTLAGLVVLVAYGNPVANALELLANGLRSLEKVLGAAARWLHEMRWWALAAFLALAAIGPILTRILNTSGAVRARALQEKARKKLPPGAQPKKPSQNSRDDERQSEVHSEAVEHPEPVRSGK